MKKHTLYSLWLLTPIALCAQAESNADIEIDLSDVVVVEDSSSSGTSSEATLDVVEIPDAPIEGASIDVAAPETPAIPTVTESLPTNTEIVLEIPGQADAAAGEATMASEETISVDFPDEDVRTILRNVADLFELNLVIPDTLQGRTSIKLRNITWRQAFEVVLEPLGYTYVEDRNIIRIKSIEELTTEPVDTRVFVVNYGKAVELQSSISPLINSAAGGQIQVDTRSNALVITERPSRMNKIQEIIERLDKATSQVMIESKFIEVTNSDIKDLGVNWASLSNYGVGVNDIERQWSRQRTSSDGQTNNSDLTAFSTSGTTSGSVGGVQNPDTVDNTEGVSSTLSSIATFASNASTGRIDTAVFSADNFRLVLSALNQTRNSELKTNPTVVVLNNQQATLNVGQQYPTREFEYNQETGRVEPGALNYEPLGVELNVTPSANDDGMINLKINPVVRVLAGTVATLNGIEDPLFEEKSVNTTVTIKDGFTLALGGLVEQTTQDQGTAVPVLGKLPGIGRFFKSDSTNVSTNNLIIFITAKTLNPDGSTYEDVVDPRVLDDMGILPRDLPGYQLDVEEKELLQQLKDYRAEKERNESLIEQKARIKQIEYRKMQNADNSKAK